LHIEGTFLFEYIQGETEPYIGVDASSSIAIVAIIGLQGDKFVTEETRRLRARMSNQRLFL
jgi:hypothetical protein